MPLQKLCSKCKQEKAAEDFYTNKRMKSGLNTYCIVCHKAANIARKQITRQQPEFKAKEIEYKKQYRARTVGQRKAYMKKWHNANAETQTIYRKEYQEANPTYFSEYSRLNKCKLNAKTRARQASKLQRTPAWVDSEELWLIKEVYSLAALRTKMFGFSWHVDHIVPLQGKLVSGLHTIANLQVIPAIINIAKANKYEVL
jgi:hypothetical protein